MPIKSKLQKNSFENYQKSLKILKKPFFFNNISHKIKKFVNYHFKKNLKHKF